jgi:hypothetical protein
MAAQRIRLGVVLAGVLVGGPAAFGQSGSGQAAPLPPPPPTSLGAGTPYLAPPSSTGTGGPTATLTAAPGPAAPLPPGSVPSPWCGASPAGAGCCGPVGANGPVTYELYARTGPDLVIGGGHVFAGALHTGWNVTGGGRSLFFNTPGDAAWYLDLGLGFTYNRGTDRVINVFSPAPRDQQGQLQGPDEIHPFRVRDLFRTTFNYAVGRFWWLNGPGYVGAESDWNSRVGLDVGGRWGTNHVNLVPVADPSNYLRRGGVSQGVFLGASWDWEKPMGGWVLFGGVRAEWGYTWMNLVPPQDGDLQDVHLLMTVGWRF